MNSLVIQKPHNCLELKSKYSIPPILAMQIDQAQGITLRAFFEAVTQQTAPLPEDLQQQMNTIGEMFTTDINSAIDQLINLAQHPRLETIYSATRQELQKYQKAELNLSLQIPAYINLPPEILENTQSILQSPEQPIDKTISSPNQSKWWHFFFPTNLKK